MLTFIQTHATGSDCTAPYDVKLDKPYTVGEFIKEVLTTFPNEWGEFVVNRKCISCFETMARTEYRYGNTLSGIPEEIVSLPIKVAKAAGGWSNMDYYLMVE